MTDQQSSNPNDWIAAGDLDSRQHILVRGHGEETVFKVEHSLPYRTGAHQMVALTLAPVGGGEPQGVKWLADYQVQLASEDQVAEAVYAARRAVVVADLRALADLIADCRVRIRPYGGPGIGINLADGEVTRLAEALELVLSDYGQTSRSAVWRSAGSDEYGEGVTATFYGKPAPEPTYRVAFDLDSSVKPITVPADTTVAELSTRIREVLLAAELIDGGHDISVVIDGDDDATVVMSGGFVVFVDGHVVERGSIVRA